MKSLFEEMGGTYRQEGDYFIPNLTLPNDGDYKIGKYGRMRLDHLKKHRKILYTKLCDGRHFIKASIRDRPSLQRAYENHRSRHG